MTSQLKAKWRTGIQNPNTAGDPNIIWNQDIAGNLNIGLQMEMESRYHVEN